MITDNGLTLATAEAAPNAGGAGVHLGAASVTLGLDASASGPLGLDTNELGTSELELTINVTTSSSASIANAIDFQLISLPIAFSKLSNASSGTGKQLAITGLTVPSAAPALVTVAAHGLPLGAPVYFSAGTGGTGITTNTIYYVVPVAANTFALAPTLADALSSTGNRVEHTGASFSSAVLRFVPFIHAVTGPIPAPFLIAGNRFTARCQPWTRGVLGKQVLPGGQTTRQQLGAVYGPGNNTGGGTIAAVMPVPGRYLGLAYDITGTVGSGAFTVNLALQSQDGMRYHPTGLEAL